LFKRILVPIDIEQLSSWEAALPQAIELAQASGGAVTVVTVVRDLKAMFEGVQFPFQLELMMSRARGKLWDIVSAYRGGGSALEEEVRFGSVGHEILATARERKADLILMASHRPELKDYLIGPNAAHVAQHADCSVLVLRSMKHGDRD
jgi:nucleotide-binding universal stress UspA family protein